MLPPTHFNRPVSQFLKCGVTLSIFLLTFPPSSDFKRKAIKLYHFWLNSVSCLGNKVLCNATKLHLKTFNPIFYFCINYFINSAWSYQCETSRYYKTHHRLVRTYVLQGSTYQSPDPGCYQRLRAVPGMNLWPAGQCQERQQWWGHWEFLSPVSCSLSWACFVALIGLKKHLHWGFRNIFTLPLYPTQKVV